LGKNKKTKTRVDIEFVPFEKLDNMSFEKRVKFIIDIVKAGKILVVDSKLSAQEESELIAKTMENVNEGFPGIELSSLAFSEKRKKSLPHSLKKALFKLITGRDRGLTIIGPAKIVKEIKRDPEKVSILMH